MTRSGLLVATLSTTAILALPQSASADAGVLRCKATVDQVEVSVFTDPTPVRSGILDVYILVRPLVSGRLAAPTFQVCTYPGGSPEKKHCEASVITPAFNKLFRAAQLEFPEPGRWQVEVNVDEIGTLGTFLIEVEQTTGGSNSWALWIGLPAAAVGVFAVHQRLVHRRQVRPAPTPSASPEAS